MDHHNRSDPSIAKALQKPLDIKKKTWHFLRELENWMDGSNGNENIIYMLLLAMLN